MTRPKLLLIAGLLAAFAAAAPAHALDIGVDLGGIGVDVGIGGDGVDVGVGIGGVDVGVSLGGSSTSTGLPPDAVALDHEGALKAVREDKALPLDAILKANGAALDGEVIDAQLISYRGFLLYEIKVLATGGELADAYFYAQSGRPVAER